MRFVFFKRRTEYEVLISDWSSDVCSSDLAIADQVIYDPEVSDARSLVGRVLERGLSEEYADRHYLIVEATDGRSHYVEIGKGEIVPPHANGAILRIAPVETGIREVDRTIVAVAAANDGRYTIDAHLKHEPNASQTFAESHERRLEAMRRADAQCHQIGRAHV